MFFCEKPGPEGTIAKVIRERKEKSQKSRKNRSFCGRGVWKSPLKMRLRGVLCPARGGFDRVRCSGTEKNWKEAEQKISRALKLSKRAVALAFLDRVPAGAEKFDGTEPSGSSFWRLASEARFFSIVPENHFICAVGAYTHNITLFPSAPGKQTLKMRFNLGSLKLDEVLQIPRLPKTSAAIVYGPLGVAPRRT
jgi:hypothetical protein